MQAHDGGQATLRVRGADEERTDLLLVERDPGEILDPQALHLDRAVDDDVHVGVCRRRLEQGGEGLAGRQSVRADVGGSHKGGRNELP